MLLGFVPLERGVLPDEWDKILSLFDKNVLFGVIINKVISF
jgi:hypothetical protein